MLCIKIPTVNGFYTARIYPQSSILILQRARSSSQMGALTDLRDGLPHGTLSGSI
jgi:hypothetical protein